jgi:ribonuclease BN (tRNA processing enzyme)
LYRALISIRVIWISHHHADHICGFPLLLENINRARILYKRHNLTFNHKNKNTKKSKDSENENNGSKDDTNDEKSTNIRIKSMNLIDMNLCKITVIAPPDVIRYYEYTACISGLEELVTFVPINATLFAGYMIPLDGNRYAFVYKYKYICKYIYVYA